jgi:hypothetical protein
MRSKILPFKPNTKPQSSDKGAARLTSGQLRPPSQVAFHRTELALILNVYGQMVSQGDWKDYAMDFLKDRAIFSVYRRASEHALYRIEKTPALKAKQGQYSVIAQGGLILKRGHDLKTVLRVFDRQRFRVAD